MEPVAGISMTPVQGLPLFGPGMSVARALLDAIHRQGEGLGSEDVCVIAQKIVSKSEGRYARVQDVEASPEATRIAGETEREPQMIQLILDESSEILRATPAAIIARHRCGHVLANAGIDASNVGRVLRSGADSAAVLSAVCVGDIDANCRRLLQAVDR